MSVPHMHYTGTLTGEDLYLRPRREQSNQQGRHCRNAYSTRTQVWVRPKNRMDPRISSFLPPSMTVTLAL